MVLKQGDFIELDYTGKIKDTGLVFDTTRKDIAEKNDLQNRSAVYKPIIICIGENNVVSGLDSGLEGKEAGREYHMELKPEESFGKKNAKLIQLVSAAKFKEQKVSPYAGMQINIDGAIGTIKHVSGGRVMVDFNHPLAGLDVIYDIKINRLVEDDAEKVKALFELKLNVPDKDIEVKIEGDTAKLKFRKGINIPSELIKIFQNDITRVVPNVKKLETQ